MAVVTHGERDARGAGNSVFDVADDDEDRSVCDEIDTTPRGNRHPEMSSQASPHSAI